MLKKFIQGIRDFFKSMGLVEQAQVVASTAVVVAMVTVITMRIVVGEELGLLDFITVTTIGIFGFVSIFFALKYGRILEQQRRELYELNTIAEAVNHSVELDYVLQSALAKVMEFMRADYGWIYIAEDHGLTLKHLSGTPVEFFPQVISTDDPHLAWIKTPLLAGLNDANVFGAVPAELRRGGFLSFASIPLLRQTNFAGVLIIGSREPGRFAAKKLAVMQAFGNQINAALGNASLFEQVRQSEQRYADLYEHSPDMYHSVDRNGVIIGCNVTECEILGKPKEEIIGKPLHSLYPAAYHHTLDLNLRRIFLKGQELKGIEEQIRRADGSLLDVSVNTSLIHDEAGNPAVARMVLRDITEKKQMETKILQAQKIDSLGNITGGIAHDFNNILTAMLGAASIMRRKVGDDARLVKYIDLIEQTSRRGANITRQLMTFARKHPPHIDRIDVRDVIIQTLKLFEVSAPKSIHIKFTPGDEALIVEGDEVQLQQAIWNLCLNARDAMPSGGILVITCAKQYIDEHEADTRTDGKPGSYVVISIADSGSGIPTDVLPHIFEPFFTTKEKEKGSGLGLSVVYGVVKGHNGSINVASEVNSGTLFTIYLPQVLDGAHETASHRDRTAVVGGHERILIVEDEISVGTVGSDILKDLGYTIVHAQNGRDAIEILSSDPKPFSLVILDMNMPRMGGKATFDLIKQLNPALRVLVCSGYSATMLDDGKFTQSIDGFVQKPYELEEFAYRVRMVLDSPPKKPA
jgi:PAS domain S-box-containing protein